MPNVTAGLQDCCLLGSFNFFRDPSRVVDLVWEKKLAASHPLVPSNQGFILRALAFLQRPVQVLALSQTVFPSGRSGLLFLLLLLAGVGFGLVGLRFGIAKK